MENEKILKVTKLKVIYNDVNTAIEGVSFSVAKTSIFAIIGANGAGKTTTLRAISGFLGSDNAEIREGDIIFKGLNISGYYPHVINRMGIVIVPEREKVLETLTVEENMWASQASEKNRKEMLDRVYKYFPRLQERRRELAGYLSGGERQMLGIACALLCMPELILLDEVSLGLAPLVTSSILKAIVQMKEDLHLTLLLVEQNAAVALDIADHAAVLENGRVVLDGSPEKLLGHADVREFYLGMSESGEQKSYRDVKQYKRTRRWWG